VGGPKVRHVFC
jgi:hypothetical protein